ncbi:MAG: hypothetical protein INR65_03260 [Gluconacetobacter diazotrophicus]|nr:hypothetical protein [Gluconacetobacter diazotrophicus]
MVDPRGVILQPSGRRRDDPAMASTAPNRAVAGTSPADRPGPFDAWLQSRLQRLYDEALAEPVPDHMLDLLTSQRSD